MRRKDVLEARQFCTQGAFAVAKQRLQDLSSLRSAWLDRLEGKAEEKQRQALAEKSLQWNSSNMRAREWL